MQKIKIKMTSQLFDVRMLARKMISMINKSADWRPNYHKTECFPKSSAPPHLMNQLTLNEPAIKNRN